METGNDSTTALSQRLGLGSVRTHAEPLLTPTSLRQRSHRYIGPVTRAGQTMQRLCRRGLGPLGPRGVARTLEEQDAAHGREALQIRQRERHRSIDHAMNHRRVTFGVDGWHAAVVSLEVQIRWVMIPSSASSGVRDAVEPVTRRCGPANGEREPSGLSGRPWTLVGSSGACGAVSAGGVVGWALATCARVSMPAAPPMAAITARLETCEDTCRPSIFNVNLSLPRAFPVSQSRAYRCAIGPVMNFCHAAVGY